MTALPGTSSCRLVVVIAEDEISIRDVAVELLAAQGFVPLPAQHAAEALAIIEARPEQIHVLFTDVEMPGLMNGIDLVRHVRGRWPLIGLLVVSGTGCPASLDLSASCRFLTKPYKLEEIASHIRELAPAR